MRTKRFNSSFKEVLSYVKGVEKVGSLKMIIEVQGRGHNDGQVVEGVQ